MREIIFRGKRDDTGEWIEGYFGQSVDTFIIQDYGLVAGHFKVFKVIPETFGQFTGLTDKDGKRIFEGDVLKMEIKLNYINPLQAPLVFIGVCKFKDGAFGFSKQRAGIEEFTAFSSTTYNVEFEIIGNIHDNPEML